MDKPFIFWRPLVLPADPTPVADPRPESFEQINQGTYPLPSLPWPMWPIGPEPMALLSSDVGMVLTGDDGTPLVADGAALPPSDPANSDIGGNPPPPLGVLFSEP